MVEKGDRMRFDPVYSKKIKAGKRRTYFFDVRETKSGDYYITLTESSKKLGSDIVERHKIFLYKEDFGRFVKNLSEIVDYVKTKLMPDFDFEELERRQEEWEQKFREEGYNNQNHENSESENDVNW